MSRLRVLVLDIETAPMTVYVWNLKDQYVDKRQIKTDWFVLAWGAKWLGDPPSKLIYRDQSRARRMDNDGPMLRELWRLMNRADVVLTMNGQAFDGPKLNARFMLNGFRPPRPYKHLDVYRLAKRVAAFTSHSLEYLTQRFCKKYKKLSHGKFPGLSLWTECLDRNPKAWAEMRKYNVHDVLSTEELYGSMKAWAPESMPTPFGASKTTATCKTCGEKGQMVKRGTAVKIACRYQRWQCQTCGRWATGEKIGEAV